MVKSGFAGYTQFLAFSADRIVREIKVSTRSEEYPIPQLSQVGIFFVCLSALERAAHSLPANKIKVK